MLSLIGKYGIINKINNSIPMLLKKYATNSERCVENHMKKLRIIVADTDIGFLNELKEYLKGHEEIQIIEILTNGEQVIKKIKELKPDVLLINVVMPSVDGIGILRNIKEKAERGELKKPLIMAISRVGKDHIINRVMDLGVEYYMVKPIDMEVFIERIKELHLFEKEIKLLKNGDHSYEKSLKLKLASLMIQLGIPSSISGYRYLKEALFLVIQDKDNLLISNITKELYPTVAKKFDTTGSRVELAIRRAIRKSWERENSQLKKYGYVSRPSNSEFIANFAEQFKIKAI